jgi:hypothetical protein
MHDSFVLAVSFSVAKVRPSFPPGRKAKASAAKNTGNTIFFFTEHNPPDIQFKACRVLVKPCGNQSPCGEKVQIEEFEDYRVGKAIMNVLLIIN